MTTVYYIIIIQESHVKNLYNIQLYVFCILQEAIVATDALNLTRTFTEAIANTRIHSVVHFRDTIHSTCKSTASIFLSLHYT